MYCSTFPAFGKDVLKSFKVSPDSFIQMAFTACILQKKVFSAHIYQSATLSVATVLWNVPGRLHKTPGAHYESAGLRKFIHGRTETIRSCSQE
ncbi:unnamed protein product, partial [Timema podura]|nr:unnamed protein product [Timema podura]